VPPIVKPVTLPRAFALLLDTACSEFEALRAIVSGEFRLTMSDLAPTDLSHVGAAPRALPTIRMALAKSFVSNAIRARRICEHGSNKLSINRIERKIFLNGLSHTNMVRNVNEHGFEIDAKDFTKPKLHFHASYGGYADETTLAIIGPDEILMGPINLCEVYRVVDRMRKVAGFASLPPYYPILSDGAPPEP
jgi:hypothetical protein